MKELKAVQQQMQMVFFTIRQKKMMCLRFSYVGKASQTVKVIDD